MKGPVREFAHKAVPSASSYRRYGLANDVHDKNEARAVFQGLGVQNSNDATSILQQHLFADILAGYIPSKGVVYQQVSSVQLMKSTKGEQYHGCLKATIDEYMIDRLQLEGISSDTAAS